MTITQSSEFLIFGSLLRSPTFHWAYGDCDVFKIVQVNITLNRKRAVKIFSVFLLGFVAPGEVDAKAKGYIFQAN